MNDIDAKMLTIQAWPVGQGLFTEAAVSFGGTRFRMVYDCGVLGRAQAIQSSLADPGCCGLIDLLVISHFHWDHISHIAQLLSRSKGATIAWIPYLAPKERIICAIALAAHGQAEGASDADIRSLVSLALRPADWLAAHSVGDIEFVGQDRDDPDMKYDVRDRTDDGSALINTHLLMSPLQDWEGAFRPGSPFRAEHTQLRHGPRNTEILHMITWVRKRTTDQIDGMIERLRSVLSASSPELGHTFDDLAGADVDRLGLSDVELLSRRIKDVGGRKLLREAYRSVDTDINSSSLCLGIQGICAGGRYARLRSVSIIPSTLIPHDLCVSAIADDWLRCDTCAFERWVLQISKLLATTRDQPTAERYWRVATNPVVTWYGDVNTQELTGMLSDGEDEFLSVIESSNVWQVPHHGSKRSYCLDFYRRIGRAGSYISCGVANPFSHPSSLVVRRTGARVMTEESSPLGVQFAWY